MFQLCDKQNSSKKHITKLNLNLQVRTNINNFSQTLFCENNINLKKSKINISKKWNFFTPKIPEKKYGFDFNVEKNLRYQSKINKISGLEFFLKLNNNNSNKIKSSNEIENKDTIVNYFSEPKKLNSESKFFKNQEKHSKKIEETFTNIHNQTEENVIISPDEIYNLVKKIFLIFFLYNFKNFYDFSYSLYNNKEAFNC